MSRTERASGWQDSVGTALVQQGGAVNAEEDGRFEEHESFRIRQDQKGKQAPCQCTLL
jgi:hypothetical protein